MTLRKNWIKLFMNCFLNKINYRKILYTALILAGLVSVFGGCATVQPWERERLSDPYMMFDENPMDKGAQLHFLFIREGTEGGDGSQSGGCGCG
jgi:hypothetical protein